jgi:hypothetical protein
MSNETRVAESVVLHLKIFIIIIIFFSLIYRIYCSFNLVEIAALISSSHSLCKYMAETRHDDQ